MEFKAILAQKAFDQSFVKDGETVTYHQVHVIHPEFGLVVFKVRDDAADLRKEIGALKIGSEITLRVAPLANEGRRGWHAVGISK